MSIEERLGNTPEPWKPEPGEQLIGEVVDIVDIDGEYGTYALVTVLKDDGTEADVHCFHTVLRGEIAKRDPSPGDRIGIRYDGRHPDKEYESYRVVVERTRQVEAVGAGEPF